MSRSVRDELKRGPQKPEWVRHVVYSDSLGVFLGVKDGHGIWSRVDPAGESSAPVFKDQAQAEAELAKVTKDDVKTTWHLVEVTPDLEGGTRASIAAITNRTLPGWEPH